MSGQGIDDLAATVRAGLDADEQTARGAMWDREGDSAVWRAHLPVASYERRGVIVDYLGDGVVVVDPENADRDGVANHVARHDPRRVLAEVASLRALVDALLAEKHGAAEHGVRYYPCEALAEPPGPCDCGRDARVAGYLALLACPYQEETR